MPRQFTRGRGRLGAPRRETSWLVITPNTTTVTGAGGTIHNSLTTAEKAKRPFTVIRTHLFYAIETDQIAATEDFGGAIGMAVVSDQAEAIGVTAVPTPVADAESDLWFLHEWFAGNILFGSAIGFDTFQRQSRIDSKAMRKVNDGEDIVVVSELSTGLGAGGFGLHLAGRLLIKEH